MERKFDWRIAALKTFGSFILLASSRNPEPVRAQDSENKYNPDNNILLVCQREESDMALFNFTPYPQVMVNGRMREYSGRFAVVNYDVRKNSAYLVSYGTYDPDGGLETTPVYTDEITRIVPRKGYIFQVAVLRLFIPDLPTYSKKDLQMALPDYCSASPGQLV